MNFPDRRVSALRSRPGRAPEWASAGVLSGFRGAGAYVLLGDPGMGKTTAFQRESGQSADGRFLTVRDFLALPPGSGGAAPETLFLDGLDEVRAAGDDPRRPFDRLRERLDARGKPRFRLSCRPLEWLGDDDRARLEARSPDGEVAVLRLEPLGEAEIAAFLERKWGLQVASLWLAASSVHRSAAVLGNPLTLRLFAEAARGGEEWPGSWGKAFERACRRLIVERNPQYRIRPAKPHEAEALLDAAGDLSTRLLLCGASGFTLHPEFGGEDYLALDADPAAPGSPHRVALASRLFTGGTPSRIEPVHRQIAEFLAARYLARRVDGGFPRLRLLALLTGSDGVPPTSLRGLAAWLAAFSRPLRARLIAADPYAVAQYGDIEEFSLEERRSLLAELRRRAEHSPADVHSGLADRLLTAPDLLGEVVEMLRSDTRTPADEAALQFLIPSLPDSLPDELTDELLRTATDSSRPGGTRWLAARAFARSIPPERGDEALRLLRQIRDGEMADPDDDLRGQLLTRLYPRRVPPAEVWDHLPRVGRGADSGASLFWSHELLERSSSTEAAELLDALSSRLSAREPAFLPDWKRLALADLPARLLTRGLEAHGETIGAARLHDWLRVAQPEPGSRRLWPADADGIRKWLSGRPAIQKAVLTEALTRRSEAEDGALPHLDVHRLLYGTLPPDYGRFCLDSALDRAQEHPNLARWLLGEAVNALQSGTETENFTLDLLVDLAGEIPLLAEHLPPLLRTDLDDRYFRSFDGELREAADADARVNEWLARVRRNLDALRENRAPPRLLHDLGSAFYGLVPGSEGSDPSERFRRLFRGDDETIAAAWTALRGTPKRADAPALPEIARMGERRRRNEESAAPWFAPAFLAAARDAADAAPDGIPDWSGEDLERFLAFHCARHYARPHRQSGEPALAARLAAERPESAAKVVVEFAAVELRTGGEPTDLCYDLAKGEGLAAAARLAVPPLLRAFPTRAPAAQLESLEWLLRAALRRGDPAALVPVVAKKANSLSMSSAQRVLWLAAGLVVSPDDYRGPLADLLEASPDRAAALGEFLFAGEPGGRGLLPEAADAETLGLLTRALGNLVKPLEWNTTRFRWVGAYERAETAVGELIGRLGADPSASAVLDDLIADEGLADWRPELASARERQRPLARDAAFRHPSPKKLSAALDDGPPAGAADLAFLVEDRLRRVGDDLRGGDANPWRLLWNETGSGREPAEPKHEDSCRDALLSLLRPLLPEGVKVRPEGRHADDRRSDFVVTYGDFAIPVEIKKNTHRMVWSSASRQLAARYATDPAADGHGIYLVLWLDPNRTAPAPEGRRPDSPEEMEERLRRELLRDGLPPTDARKITVCVLDARRPRDRASAPETSAPAPPAAEPRAPYRAGEQAPPGGARFSAFPSRTGSASSQRAMAGREYAARRDSRSPSSDTR